MRELPEWRRRHIVGGDLVATHEPGKWWFLAAAIAALELLPGCSCSSRSGEGEAAEPAPSSEVTAPSELPSVTVSSEPPATTTADPESPAPPLTPTVSAEPDPTSAPTPDPTVAADPPPTPMLVEAPEVLGPWGTELALQGQALRWEGETELWLSIGDLEVRPEDEWVLEWTSTEIRLRVPFPHQGDVGFHSSRGQLEAGSFTSEWRLSSAFSIADGTSVLASLSPAPASIALVVDTTPLQVLQFDGSAWRSAELGAELRPWSVHLFTQTGEVFVLGLTNEDPARAVVLSESDDWQATELAWTIDTPTPETVALAGGVERAALWWSVEGAWSGAVAGASGWRDTSTVAQPDGLSDATPVTTAAGDLYILHAVDTGNFLDDHETPYFVRLAPDGDEFDGSQRAGEPMDDYLTALSAFSRGHGFYMEYCGSDVDPLALTGTANRCRGAGHTDLGEPLLAGPTWGEHKRYAFTQQLVGVSHCSSSAGNLVTSHYDVEPGAVMAWPCVLVDALEIDPSGNWLPIVRHEGALLPLLTDHHAAVEAVPVDAGAAPLDGSTGVDASTTDAGVTEAGL